MDVRVYYGRPDSGKSRRAHEEAGRDVYRWIQGNGLWFDGYVGQSGIILDDFSGGAPYQWLLNFLDRYPMMLPVKNSFVPMVAKTVWITSNVHPNQWYEYDNKKPYTALERRITLLEEMKKTN